MARNRIIKPDFWDDEKLCKITRDARLTFIGLWNNSDDYGVVKGHPGWLKSRIFPYDEDLSLDILKTWLQSLENIRVIIPFMAHDEKYYFIVNFLRHQTIDKPSKTRNPEPPKKILDEYSDSSSLILEDEIEVKRSIKEKENTPPTPQGVQEGKISNNHSKNDLEVKEIFNFWNSQKIIQHKDYKKYKPSILAKLKIHTKAEILEAISNYKKILDSEDHFVNYKWPLSDFLTRKNAFDNYLTLNDPFENYRKRVISFSPGKGKTKQEILAEIDEKAN